MREYFFYMLFILPIAIVQAAIIVFTVMAASLPAWWVYVVTAVVGAIQAPYINKMLDKMWSKHNAK